MTRDADPVASLALAAGCTFWSGVPCSLLQSMWSSIAAAPGLTFRVATQEGEAVAIAAGATLGGRRSGVLLQNSGLGNTVNPITSLCQPYELPLTLVIGYRGEPGVADEPQHQTMGAVSEALLRLLGVRVHRARTTPELEESARVAFADVRDHKTTSAVLVSRGVAVGEGRGAAPATPDRRASSVEILSSMTMEREAALEVLVEHTRESAVVTTTGYTSRDLWALADAPNHFYVFGSMGCAPAIGLGVHEASARPVVVIDGDGASLMKLGSFATIGRYAPSRFKHVVLDNGQHESTGGQSAAAADFAAVALACGYAAAIRVGTREDLATAMRREHAGPTLIHVRVGPSVRSLPRPSIAPRDVATRFSSWLGTPR